MPASFSGLDMVAAMATERGFDRLVNFGDAVVAIAITLLVLPLVDLHTSNPELTLGDLWRHHSFEFIAFLVSFAVIGRFWLAHHAAFEAIVAYDQFLLLVNMAWLLTVAFLPFPTQMLSGVTSDRSAIALYVGTVGISSACLALIRWHVRRCKPLRTGADDSDDLLGSVWVTPGIFVVVFIVAVSVPAIGMWAMFLLFADPWIDRFLVKRDRRRRRLVEVRG
jgi:uncharacterized membrane protein